jgi:hypothetical protein
MPRRTLAWLRPSLATAAAVATLAACNDETSFGPDGASAPVPPAASATLRGPDLGTCGDLEVDAGSQLVFHAYARGVQIYQWSGQAWLPAGPRADLYSDPAGTDIVGTHYKGPTWKSTSGSLVEAKLKTPCPRDPKDIPWLLLDATRSAGPGIFKGVTQIQRVNTVGGPAPAESGSTVGELREVPYTAEYYFYRSR